MDCGGSGPPHEKARLTRNFSVRFGRPFSKVSAGVVRGTYSPPVTLTHMVCELATASSERAKRELAARSDQLTPQDETAHGSDGDPAIPGGQGYTYLEVRKPNSKPPQTTCGTKQLRKHSSMARSSTAKRVFFALPLIDTLGPRVWVYEGNQALGITNQPNLRSHVRRTGLRGSQGGFA